MPRFQLECVDVDRDGFVYERFQHDFPDAVGALGRRYVVCDFGRTLGRVPAGHRRARY